MLLENWFLNLKCPIAFAHSVFFKPMFGHHFTETKDTLTHEYKKIVPEIKFSELLVTNKMHEHLCANFLA